MIENTSFRIAVIDDKKEIREMVIESLQDLIEKMGFEIENLEFIELENAKHAIQFFEEGETVNLITLDYHMTNGQIILNSELNGDSFLKSFKKFDTLIPIIGVSTDPKKEIIEEMKELGCIHFINKEPLFEEQDDNIDRKVFLTILELLILNHKKEVKILKLLEDAKKDHLTGLKNRKTFYEKYNQLKDNAEEKCVIIADIDKFKNINDTYGHDVGDEVIKICASRINQSTKDGDIVARFGGEEFVVVIMNSNINNSYHAAERIRKNIEEEIVKANGKSISMTISIGLSNIKKDEDIDEAIKRADQGLYQSKNNGRNKTSIIVE